MVDTESAFFQATPWCAALLNSPNYVLIPTPSRRPKQSTEDALLAETLKTKTTIPAMTTLYKKPVEGLTLISEACVLVALEHGINGYPSVAHGGFLGVIIDESMGTLLMCNKNTKKDEMDQAVDVDTLVTASLKVDYLKAVVTPQIVLVTVKFGEIKGRKFHITGSVTDGSGTVLAKAEALWVGVKLPRARKL